MKNWNMKPRLMVSYLLVALLTLAAGVTGVLGVHSLSRNESEIYQDGVRTNAYTDLQRNIQAQRAAYRGAGMLYLGGSEYDEELTVLQELNNEFRASMDTLHTDAGSEEAASYLAAADAAYTGSYLPTQQLFINALAAGDDDTALQALYSIVSSIEIIQGNLESATADALQTMALTEQADTRSATVVTIVVAVVVVLAVGLAAFFAFYITSITARPLERMAREVRKLSTGNFDVHPDIDQDDEIGVVDKALWHIVHTMLEQQEGIVRMAEGDYTAQFPVRCPEDSMNKALNALADTFASVMGQIRNSSQQVSAGAEQVAQASQHLAAGASQQAMTIEHLTDALTAIQNMAETNAATAAQTLDEVREAGQLAGQCNQQMEEMLGAMKDIDGKSQSISSVIKVIDDIAFQTNILALNAAVEAARAGQHGKGFAVVADEVRNLATKSAEAARETAGFIEQSLRSVAQGNTIVGQVSDSIRAMEEISARNESSIARMDEASDRQKDSIIEVTGGVQQLSAVVQSNTANAEQTAAASEEMASQANLLDEILRQFHFREQGAQAPAGDATNREHSFSLDAVS